MGEIGINWHEYLYRLRYWQILLITRGYLCRLRPSWEQARLVAYNAAFAFGSKNTPDIYSWFRFPWEREKEDEILDEEAINEIREKIKAENKRNGKS